MKEQQEWIQTVEQKQVIGSGQQEQTVDRHAKANPLVRLFRVRAPGATSSGAWYFQPEPQTEPG